MVWIEIMVMWCCSEQHCGYRQSDVSPNSFIFISLIVCLFSVFRLINSRKNIVDCDVRKQYKSDRHRLTLDQKFWRHCVSWTLFFLATHLNWLKRIQIEKREKKNHFLIFLEKCQSAGYEKKNCRKMPLRNVNENLVVTAVDVKDMRWPTSLGGHGSDAMVCSYRLPSQTY